MRDGDEKEDNENSEKFMISQKIKERQKENKATEIVAENFPN